METFQILSDQFSHFQHLFHRWLAIFCIISSYIFDLSSSPHTWGIRGRILSIVFLPVHPHLCWAYPSLHLAAISQNGSSPHTWGIPAVRAFMAPAFPVHPHIRGAYGHRCRDGAHAQRFIPTYVGHTAGRSDKCGGCTVHPHIRGAYASSSRFLCRSHGSSPHTWGIPSCPQWSSPCSAVHPHIRGAYMGRPAKIYVKNGSSPHTWGIHWTAVRKMAGFSHFSYDFTRKSYFVQGLVFFGVIGAEAFPTHRRGRSQCLPGAHGGSVRNL